MKELQNKVLLAVFVIAMTALVAFGQGPLHKRVNYSINVSYALKMGDYVLPAGKYVLYQPEQNDLNLFALYKGEHMMDSPIAMIRTTRIDYQTGQYPENTTLELDIESRSDDLPTLKGWNIPGMDGWEIISVVPEHNSGLMMAKDYHPAKYKARSRRPTTFKY